MQTMWDATNSSYLIFCCFLPFMACLLTRSSRLIERIIDGIHSSSLIPGKPPDRGRTSPETSMNLSTSSASQMDRTLHSHQ
jgi:hypothetical protein